IPYLRQVTGGALATLAEQQRLPHPRNLTSHSASESVHLQWLPTDNAFVAGYNIYRSDSAGGTFQKINTLPVNDTMYSDIPPLVNKQFYYSITTVNDSLEESGLSNEVIGARINFCDSLLVIANTKGTKTTPDSVRAFYQAVLDTIPYRWVDANALFQPDLNLLSRYRTIFWMSNTIEAESMNTTLYQSMMAFTENGGNLLFAGFNPGKFWIGSQVPYPLDVPEDIYFHGCFKIDSIDKKVQSMLCGANAAAEGYEALSIDSSKCMDKNFPGQIYNIEVYTPDDPGTVIYRFDSRYDSVTSYGKMKHRPVGIEYMGTDHKSILLSFPLWYLDTADAHRFVHFVMNRKFRTHTGLADLRGHSGIGLEVYPNPARREVTIQIHPLREGVLQLSLASAEGRVFPVTTQRVPAGSGQIRFAAALLPPGQYQVVAVYEGFTETCKLIIVR
ncbi:MAG TPA: T9SS type A sorting domain-containing protein, partial [Bacteroidales bacterium]|nr:T9SS type A sorting domain-containing protein [Bacteroidales bacterium]